MATAETEQAPPAFPDYMLDPDAVIKDDAAWRSARPDYSETRKIWAEGSCQYALKPGLMPLTWPIF